MALQIEEELSFNDYLSILKRRWISIASTTIVIIFAVIGAAMVLPSTYTSEGSITIDSPIISKQLFGEEKPGDVSLYVGQRIDKIEAKVLSKQNLININEKYNLYPGLKEPKKVALALRENIKIVHDKKSADGTQWGNKVTAGMKVTAVFSDPDNAYKIANEIIEQLLNENAKDRSSRATETTSFLTTELNEIKGKLEVVENKVAAYKRKHTDSLPEHLDMHMGMLEQLRKTSDNLDRDYKATQEEVRYLDVEYTTLSASATRAEGTSHLVVVSRLDKAKAELERSLVVYKDTHPTVRALKRKVDLLEKTDKSVVTVKPKSAASLVSEIALTKIKSKMEAAKARLISIRSEQRSINTEMTKTRSQVSKIPEVERGLATLLRDYVNEKQKYDDVKSKQVNAKIAEKLESENKAERFTLVKSPVIPEYRTSPQRTKMVAIGSLVALAAGIALAAILEFLDKRIRGLARITSVINMKPIAVIPFIDTHEEIHKRNSLVKYTYIITVTLAILLLFAVIYYFFMMPLK